MAEQSSHSRTHQEAKSTYWVYLCGLAVVALAVGLAVGFVVGAERGKATYSAEVRNANKVAADAVELQKEAESKLSAFNERFNQLIASQQRSSAKFDENISAATKENDSLKTRLRDVTAKLEAVTAEKKAKDEDARRKIAVGEADQNDLALDFIDKSANFQGQELTVRVRFGPRPGSGRRIEYDLKKHVDVYTEAQPDGVARTKIWFYGTGRAGSHIDLVILVSPTLELPSAQLDDPLLVTFKCGTSASSGNVATRVVRPAK